MIYVCGLVFITADIILLMKYDDLIKQFYVNIENGLESKSKEEIIASNRASKPMTEIVYDYTSFILYLNEKLISEGEANNLDEYVSGTGKFNNNTYFSEISRVLSELMNKPYSNVFLSSSYLYNKNKIDLYLAVTYSPSDFGIKIKDVISKNVSSVSGGESTTDDGQKKKKINVKNNDDGIDKRNDNDEIEKNDTGIKVNQSMMNLSSIQAKLNSSNVIAARNISVIDYGQIMRTIHPFECKVVNDCRRYLCKYAKEQSSMMLKARICRFLNLKHLIAEKTKNGDKKVAFILSAQSSSKEPSNEEKMKYDTTEGVGTDKKHTKKDSSKVVSDEQSSIVKQKNDKNKTIDKDSLSSNTNDQNDGVRSDDDVMNKEKDNKMQFKRTKQRKQK